MNVSCVGWVGHYFGWVGVSGGVSGIILGRWGWVDIILGEWGWLHCLIMPLSKILFNKILYQQSYGQMHHTIVLHEDNLE